jgi:phosphoribosylaminoimidazole-succinocarboxamide synthase
VQTTGTLLIRVMIAKVEDEKRLTYIFRTTPVIQGDPNWYCCTWVADVLSRMAKDGKSVGTAQLDWSKIEAVARNYVAGKSAVGRYDDANTLLLPRPTWDIIEGREIVP